MPVPLKPQPKLGENFENFVLYNPGPRMWLDGSWVAKDTKIFKLADDKDLDKARKLSKLCDKMADANYDYAFVKKIREENAGLF